MGEILIDTDQMALCDAARATENGMYKRCDFDWLHPNEIPIDAGNILKMSIEIRQESFAAE